MADTAAIRRAQPSEAGQLTAIALGAKRYWGYPELWIEAWRDDLVFTPTFIAANPVYVATGADGIPVACYALVGDEDIQLEHLWVEPESMGRGLGRSLFEHAAATARSNGGVALLIDSDPNAESFYERMGATRVGSLRADVCGERRELPQMRYNLL